jgi:cyclase
MKVAVIDYQSGNLASVANGLARFDAPYTITADPDVIRDADRVIFPGVGRAAPAMEALKKRGLDTVIRGLKMPFLGICLGMQLLLPFSEEDEMTCIGIVRGRVKGFPTDRGPGFQLKVPQIGWNVVHQVQDDPLFRDIPDGSYFYFVNSYYVDTDDRATLGKTNYGEEFVSILKQDNFYGVQFHPEKSGPIGLRLLRNFCELEFPEREKTTLIPAIDILDGKCVRLTQGDYTQRKIYSDDPLNKARTFQEGGVDLIHIVDLNGAREGIPVNRERILEIARSLQVPIQVGGGIRTYADARAYLTGGVTRVILGTSALANPSLVQRLLGDYGKERIVVAVDVRDGVIAIKGWQEPVETLVFDFLETLREIGVELILLTDITKDGMLGRPNFGLTKRVLERGFRVMVAGGVSSNEDIRRLAGMGAYGVIVGKALYEGKIDLRAWVRPDHGAALRSCGPSKRRLELAKRIVPCMDIKQGRVVKGTHYVDLRDAGDPVELGKLYSDMGADELVYLDIMATVEDRDALYELVERISKNINIPFTVGGGIRTLGTIRELLKCGADKVSLGSAAVLDPGFVKAAADQFGSQCIVISIDPKRVNDHWEIYIKGGREPTGIDAIDFVKHMEHLGAGELLVNSMDKDGKKDGYDIALLKAVSEAARIPVIASSGAGRKEHFLEAFREGKADAALAASLFHYRELEIPELKRYLKKHHIPIRT